MAKRRRNTLALESGLLQHLIAESYTPESLEQLKEVLTEYRTHEILPVANGLFAASSSQATDAVSGYQNVWIRDNIMVADSFRRRGEFAPAIVPNSGNC